MAYKVLYRKYRPDNFENVVGQDYTISMLKNAIINKKNAHAYIFTGPRGTGKTSSAKIFAKALNCENPIDGSPCNECISCKSFNESPDIIEIDAASNNGVDEIRELINNVKLVPSSLKYKVYIIDEVHMLTTSAFNALLLTLEEPPSHVVFILATTDIQDVPITILSRCQRFDFKQIDKVSIINRLKYISNIENIDIDDDAIEEIALVSAGGMRDALGMLDQLSSLGNKITLDIVSSNFGSVSSKKIREILIAIASDDSKLLLSFLENIRESGTNYSVFIEKLIFELRKCAIDVKLGNLDIDLYFEDIYQMIFDLNECLCNININVDPYILIEIVLLKYISKSPKKPFYEKDYEIITNENSKKEKLINTQTQKENYFPENTSEIPGNNQENDNNMGNNQVKINLEVRVNNCFVNASKEYKGNISSSWIDFMNFLMSKDRSLISLLADTSILAASDKYVLIQSKIDSTNDLINDQIFLIEKYYTEYSGFLLKFAALKDEFWKKEVEKYRLNRNNKIKYKYIDEESNSDLSDNETNKEVNNSDIEELAKDIFGSFEIE